MSRKFGISGLSVVVPLVVVFDVSFTDFFPAKWRFKLFVSKSDGSSRKECCPNLFVDDGCYVYNSLGPGGTSAVKWVYET